MLVSPIHEEMTEDDEITGERLIKCVAINISLLERYNQDWVDLLKGILGEDRAMEETECNRVADGTRFVEVTLGVSKAIAQLQVRLAQIAKRKERMG